MAWAITWGLYFWGCIILVLLKLCGASLSWWAVTAPLMALVFIYMPIVVIALLLKDEGVNYDEQDW